MRQFISKIFFLPIALLAASPLMADEVQQIARKGSFVQTLMMVGIAVLFFYFILWRPERKRRKAMEQKRSSMKKGDKITAMGIIGVIDRVKEQTVVVKMIDGAKVEFLKAAISEVHAKEEGDEETIEMKAEAKA
ncbi:MAG: preprotein translocase subunit YajC [Chlamydiales bacterium]